MPSIIDVKKTPTWGESRFPARLLGDKTAQRYFSGRLKDRVKETSRAKIISAISETLAASVFAAGPAEGHEGWSNSSRLATVLDWHAVNWDRLRAFLLPRTPLVYPRHLASVWQVYVKLAAIDLALRAAAYTHIAGASPEVLEFLNWTGDTRRGDYLNRKRLGARITVNDFAESTGVSVNAAEGGCTTAPAPRTITSSASPRLLLQTPTPASLTSCCGNSVGST